MKSMYAPLFASTSVNSKLPPSTLIESIYWQQQFMPLWDFHWARLCISAAIQGWSGWMMQEQELLALIEKYTTGSSFKTLKLRIKIEQTSFNTLKASVTMEDWHQATFHKKPMHVDVCAATASFDGKNAKSEYALAAYSFAKKYAASNHLADVILYNSENQIVDSTLANVFLIRNGVILTNSLKTGAVAGVMRAKLLTLGSVLQYEIKELDVLTIEDMYAADGVFLTNAVRGIMPVKQIGTCVYNLTETLAVQQEIVQKIFTLA